MLDGIYLYHLKNEILSELRGFRVDKIYQPSKEELLFSFKTFEGTKKLLLSAKPESARILLTNQFVENPKKPPMLTMLLRKHLSKAKLRDIEQDGFERVLTLVFDAANELGDPVVFKLIIEIMGRHSNIVLVNEEGIIVECIKKIDEFKSSFRLVLPGVEYVLPPAQNKMNILTDSLADIESAIALSGENRAKATSSVLQGISPIVAREVENGLSLEKLREYVKKPTPTVIFLDGPKDFTYFKPLQYGDLCEYRSFETFSQLIDFFYYEQVRFERIRQRSNDLFRHLTILQERAVRKAINRKNELEECKNKEQLKIFGDLINSNLYRLEKGAPFYDLENYYDSGNTVRIPADPTLTPAQNAQKYYKEYRKKQIAETKLKDFIREAEEEAAYLESVIDMLSRAQTDSEISAIRAELYESGFLNKRIDKKNKPKKLEPKKYISSEGFVIRVGRNNVQNDELTLKLSKNYDLWFHIKDAPGSHTVVTAIKEKPFTDKLIREAAMIAVVNSKAASSSNVAVDYTLIKNVHKPNGAKFGMVIYDNYKTEYVTPNEKELSEIKEVE